MCKIKIKKMNLSTVWRNILQSWQEIAIFTYNENGLRLQRIYNYIPYSSTKQVKKKYEFQTFLRKLLMKGTYHDYLISECRTLQISERHLQQIKVIMWNVEAFQRDTLLIDCKIQPSCPTDQILHCRMWRQITEWEKKIGKNFFEKLLCFLASNKPKWLVLLLKKKKSQ